MDLQDIKMRILLLCSKFSLNENDPWLTNELADALQADGHAVTVACLNWSPIANSSENELTTETGVRVLSIPPVIAKTSLPLLNKLLKWTLSSIRAYRTLRKVLRKDSFDLLISFSPSVTMALPIFFITKRPETRSFLVQWDFFPFHHRQIGLISSSLIFHTARLAEEWLLGRFDIIGCMSRKNIEYLRSHYKIRNEQRVCLLPIWAKETQLDEIDADTVRSQYELPLANAIVVFGGQLAPGRGLEDLLKMAALAEDADSSLRFLVVGSGPQESLVNSYVQSGHHNLLWIPWIPREEYLKLIRACDLALVCTVRDVDVPTFPSKTLDYLRAGLPIVASVEESTDYGEYLTSNCVGISVAAGEPAKLLEKTEDLLRDEATLCIMRRNGPEIFKKHFEVGHIVRQILSSTLTTEQIASPNGKSV